VLSGSEKDADGGDRKGGGNGLGARLAKRAVPVSNLKGRFSRRVVSFGVGPLEEFEKGWE